MTLRLFARFHRVRILASPVVVAAGLLVIAGSQPCTAQRPYLAPGNVEVGGFVGGSYGLDQWRVMGGGNISYAVSRFIVPYAEYSYFPGIGRETTVNNASVKFSLPVHDVHGGVRLRFAPGESRIVPYVAGGVGVLRFVETPSSVTFPPEPPFTTPTVVPFTRGGETDFAINGGGGIHLYASERISFRVDVKVYKPTQGALTNPFMKITGGVFFQLR